MLSAKRIIGTRIVILMIILSIRVTPFPGAFFLIQTAMPLGDKHELNYKTYAVKFQVVFIYLRGLKNFFISSRQSSSITPAVTSS